MKKLLSLLLFLVISTASFSQPETVPVPTIKTDYLQKSKSQKTIAWILIGSGIGMIIGSIAINLDQPFVGSNNKPNKGIWLTYLGGATALTSIPLFISAHKNKKNSMKVSLKNETIPQIHKMSFVYKSVPSLSLKISL